ncbi:MAG: divergent polysaccharide deacetylase family protein [Candidatus Handelsmanbacteria bacterium]|nr:divergent polysaccharide deacetylase family protein [Candidatus Handelsmanbacteria bacterium]
MKKAAKRGGVRLVRKRRSPALHLALTALLLVAGAGLFFYSQWPLLAPEPPAELLAEEGQEGPAGSLYDQVDAALAELGLEPGSVRKARGVSLSSTGEVGDRIAVRVPADLPLMELNLYLSRLVERSGGRVLSAVERQRGQQVEIHCEAGQPTLFVLQREPELRRRAGQIALLLAEAAQGPGRWRLLERCCALRPPLGLALFPEGERLGEVLDLAQGRGHQVLVYRMVDPENRPAPEALRQQLRLDLKRVPEAMGVDLPGLDAALTAEVLREARKSELVFVDRGAALDFDAGQMAREAKARTVQLDLYLDQEDNRAAVEKRLWELAELAAQRGQALGLGQARESTLLALEAVLPRLEARGFRLIPLSQLAR